MRAHISLLYCIYHCVILSAASLTADQKLSLRDLNSTIPIQSVNFIDKRCSLDSELSKFEEINVIGDKYRISFERSATD